MIARLRGTVIEKTPDAVIIEAAGVGYEVIISAADFDSLVISEEVSVHIHDHLREDAHNLYGFTNAPTKRFFEQLIGISGVGPKVAMNVLAAAPLPQLQSAIAGGDAEVLQGVAGIGKKTAERIVVELKSKIGALEMPIGAGRALSSVDPAYQALLGLGYTPNQAAQALAIVPKSVLGEQARLKAALKELA